VRCAVCDAVTDDWVNAQCRPCSDLPGAVLLVELRNAYAWAEARLGSAIEVETALTHALAEATENREKLEDLSDLADANWHKAVELVKQIRAAGIGQPVCACGHSEGMHAPQGRCAPNLPDYCMCKKFSAQPGLSVPHTRSL
jgi:hypothetical protein